MIDRIKQLEHLSRPLEPEAEVRALLLEKVIQYSNTFLDNFNQVPAYRSTAQENTARILN
jgi:hypothetical protein